ncbi:MAG: hypothetical protein WBW33_13330, partial [Bryobacteraceae bacterium]
LNLRSQNLAMQIVKGPDFLTEASMKTIFQTPTPYNYTEQSVLLTFARPNGMGFLKCDAPSDQYESWVPVFSQFLSSFFFTG